MDTQQIPYDLIDVSTFDLAQALTLAEAALCLRGRGGRRPHPDVVRRWANPRVGCIGRDGRRLVLPAVKVGCELLTMRAWVDAFEAARVRVVAAGRRRAPVSDKQRARSIRRAEEALDRAGI